ncbi:hypothetical protein Pint_35881 [Pistacia integerrima]|uniref:Uncharacterized protein n=1 Tax=Pistacia integerrima TaxID=434235 RepID=A0ACC0Y310_9ROSI|nr:hypothetical protein Pint_35881 [Pistacia integerrima]
MKTPTVNSVTHPSSTHFLLFVFSILFAHACQRTEATAQELLKGFKATPNPSVSSFQALLSDSTDTFSLGFLRVNSKELALAVLHVPSSEQLWLANPTQLAPWSDRTQLFFNGSLVLSGPRERLFWSTETQGDRVVLLNSSNLQVQKLDEYVSILWQSFYFPTNTLLENQNFTSNMSLVSSNGLYSMRLGSNFIGLYAKFNEKSDSGQIYLRHKALEAKANIIDGQGAIYARINSDRFLGMYQVGTIPPVDMLPFNSFQRNITGFVFLRLESDGNLKGYYWDGSKWILDYQAISDTCELPNPCGSKMGYFKVREGAGKKKMDVGFGVGIGVLCGAIVVFVGAISFGSYKIWMRRRGVKQILEDEDGISPGPYKDLASASFRSIEMCNARR